MQLNNVLKSNLKKKSKKQGSKVIPIFKNGQKKMSKNENPKKLSHKKLINLYYTCSETFYPLFCRFCRFFLHNVVQIL